MNHKAMPFTAYPWCGALGATVDKWSDTDCPSCLQHGANGGNRTAATKLVAILASVKDSLPRRIEEAEGTQRGFKGSSSYGHDEYWDD